MDGGLTNLEMGQPSVGPQDRQIAEALIQDIMDWRLPPGAWIREREVAERFDVSHAPVREALRQVARAGFVELAPYRGARVIELDLHAADELFELWKSLYGVVCRLAAENFDGDPTPLLTRLDDYEAIIRSTPDPTQHIPFAFELGRYIRDNCGGSLAPELLSKVGRLVRWQHKLLREEDVVEGLPGSSSRSAALSRQVVEAIIARDADRAERAARDVIAISQKVVIHAIEARLAELREKTVRKPRRAASNRSSSSKASRPG